jgi:hypothetical protein
MSLRIFTYHPVNGAKGDATIARFWCGHGEIELRDELKDFYSSSS